MSGLSFKSDDQRQHDLNEQVVTEITNLSGQEIEVSTPASANSEFVVYHKLRDRVPVSIETLRSTTGGSVYASRVSDWDTRRIFAKFTQGSDNVRIRVR